MLYRCYPTRQRIRPQNSRKALPASAERAPEHNLVDTRVIRERSLFITRPSDYSYQEIAAAFAERPRIVEKHVASAALALEAISDADIYDSYGRVNHPTICRPLDSGTRRRDNVGREQSVR